MMQLQKTTKENMPDYKTSLNKNYVIRAPLIIMIRNREEVLSFFCFLFAEHLATAARKVLEV